MTRILVLLAGIAALQAGCASVKISIPGKSETEVAAAKGASERQALKSATRQLNRTPWPEVQEVSMGSRMVGALFGGGPQQTGQQAGMTRDQAVEVYVARLERDASPAARVMSDADATLAYASQVAESGRIAAEAMTPRTDDIKLLETAIADVRNCRQMYLEAMKQLKKNGHDVSRSDMSEIKNAFSQTIRDIGVTANVIAERVAAEKALQNFAGSKAEFTKPVSN